MLSYQQNQDPKQKVAQQIMQLDSCIKTNEESIQLQQHTMQMLKQQDQTMDSIEHKLQVVDANNKKSEHVVKAMGSTWGFIKNLFGSAPKDKVPDPEPYHEKPVSKYECKEQPQWNNANTDGTSQALTM